MERTYKHSFKVAEKPITSLSVYNTGVQRCEAEYIWGPGVRDHYLIHYIMEGKGTYTVQNKTYMLSKGDMFLVYPDELVTYQADMVEPWSYCWVGFAGLDADSLIKQTDFSKQHPVLHVGDNEKPGDLLLSIYQARGAKPFEIARMTGKLYNFLAWLMETAKTETRRRKQAGLEHVQRACEYIVKNYSRPITVQDIAGNVGVCRSLLNRAFQQYMDISPVQYLTKYRMSQACILLKKTDMAVKAVAFSVGYEDPLYFSRRFRETEGCSPKEYAERHEKEREMA